MMIIVITVIMSTMSDLNTVMRDWNDLKHLKSQLEGHFLPFIFAQLSSPYKLKGHAPCSEYSRGICVTP